MPSTPGIAGQVPWNGRGEQRLFASMLLASIVIVSLLAVIPPLDFRGFRPLVELLVTIVRPEARPDSDSREVEPVPVSIAEPAVADPFIESEPLPAAAAPAAAAPPAPVLSASGVTPTANRAAERERAIAEHFDRQAAIVSPSPAIEEQRRRLAGQYQPPTREPEKKIWEKAEVDQLGRMVLRDGNCFAVLDDPNVTRRYQFETFDRYLVSCSHQRREPQELSWVAELRERYFYLQYPDGIGPEPATLAQESGSLAR